MAEMDDFNTRIIEEFRASGGKVAGQFEGAPMLLLTTVGAKSGKTRVNPMMYMEEDGRRYVFTSKAGAPTNPDWYYNLVAHPDVSHRGRDRRRRGGGHAAAPKRPGSGLRPSRPPGIPDSPSTRRRPPGSSRWWLSTPR